MARPPFDLFHDTRDDCVTRPDQAVQRREGRLVGGDRDDGGVALRRRVVTADGGSANDESGHGEWEEQQPDSSDPT